MPPAACAKSMIWARSYGGCHTPGADHRRVATRAFNLAAKAKMCDYPARRLLTSRQTPGQALHDWLSTLRWRVRLSPPYGEESARHFSNTQQTRPPAAPCRELSRHQIVFGREDGHPSALGGRANGAEQRANSTEDTP